MPKLASKEDLETIGKQLLLDRKKIDKTLIVCDGTGCKASRSQDVIDAINQELFTQEMDSKVQLRITGCHGFCEQGPIMVLEPGKAHVDKKNIYVGTGDRSIILKQVKPQDRAVISGIDFKNGFHVKEGEVFG